MTQNTPGPQNAPQRATDADDPTIRPNVYTSELRPIPDEQRTIATYHFGGLRCTACEYTQVAIRLSTIDPSHIPCPACGKYASEPIAEHPTMVFRGQIVGDVSFSKIAQD